VTRPRTVRLAIKRVEHTLDDDLYHTVNSYFGLLRQASHSHADRVRLAHAVWARGRAVSADLTKIFGGPRHG
jgi:RNA-directed DNA polymerase